jgi:hypothetical protein
MITFDRLACVPCCLKTQLIDRKVPVLLGTGMPSCEQDDICRVRASHLCFACLSSNIGVETERMYDEGGQSPQTVGIHHASYVYIY